MKTLQSTDLTCGHIPVDVQLLLIEAEHPDCTLTIIPENHETIGQVGGFHIHHGDCHPGRIDALVTPATIHSIMFYGTDIPHLITALLAMPETNWQRRDHVLAKLRALVPEELHNGY